MGPWGPLGGPRASWQLIEGVFGNILKGLAYYFVLECDFGQFESSVNPYQLWNLNNLKVSLGPRPPMGRKEQVLSKNRWKIITTAAKLPK